MNRRLLRIAPLSLLFLTASGHLEATAGPPEGVVVLHGLARTRGSMSKLERHLKGAGFQVVNPGYPSRKKTIQQLAMETIPAALETCAVRGAGRVHFVTHSMGGILVRWYLQHRRVPNLGRVVMLSPPNKGSEVVDRLRDNFIYRWIHGPAGGQLGTGADSLPRALKPPDYPVGIIAGDRTVNPILSLMIPGKDDGKVSVESTRLAGMQDFLLVHKTHPLIMNDRWVHRQVTAFLENGRFLHRERSGRAGGHGPEQREGR